LQSYGKFLNFIMVVFLFLVHVRTAKTMVQGKNYPKLVCPEKCSICNCTCNKKFNEANLRKHHTVISYQNLSTENETLKSNSCSQILTAKKLFDSIGMAIFTNRSCFLFNYWKKYVVPIDLANVFPQLQSSDCNSETMLQESSKHSNPLSSSSPSFSFIS
jgi:hypothetical protein